MFPLQPWLKRLMFPGPDEMYSSHKDQFFYSGSIFCLATLFLTSSPATPAAVVVPKNSVWKYAVGTDYPDTAWHKDSYSDLSWSSGPGILAMEKIISTHWFLASLKGGPYSEGAFPGGGQFGVMTITDSGDSLRVEWSGKNYLDQEIVSYSFSLPGDVGPVCVAKPGDATADDTHTLGDLLAAANYIFSRPGCSPLPACWLSGLLCRGGLERK